jgi:hypothetical protein
MKFSPFQLLTSTQNGRDGSHSKYNGLLRRSARSFLYWLCGAIFFLTLPTRAMNRLDALSMIESGDNDHAIGHRGEVSRYQMLPRVWRAATPSRDWSDPGLARIIAGRIMARRKILFYHMHRRLPNDFEYYALWNAPSEAMSGYFSAAVRARCERFVNLCQK